MIRRIRRRINRRSRITTWGDARALPFTEGQAIIGPGLIGPAEASRPSPATSVA